MPETNFIFKQTGGPDIIRLFDQIGSAAALAGQKVKKGAEDSTVAMEALNFGVKEVHHTVSDFAAELGGPLGRSLSELGAGGPVGLAVAGVTALAGGLVAAGVEAAHFAHNLIDQADAIGLSVTRLQELIFVGRAYGVSQEGIIAGVDKFAKSVGDAERGQGRFTKALSVTNPELLKVLQGAGTTTEKLNEFLEALSKIPDKAQQVSLISRSLGPEFVKFADALHQGAGGLDELSAAAHATGNVLSEETLRKAAKASEAFELLKGTIKNQLVSAFIELAPLIESTATKLQHLFEIVTTFRESNAGQGVPGAGLPQFIKPLSPELEAVTKQLADLEAQHAALQAAKSGQLLAGAGVLPAPQFGAGAEQNLNDQIEKLTKIRDNYVELQTAEERATAAAQQHARANEQAVGNFLQLSEKLKPDLQKINDEEQRQIDQVKAAVQAGAEGAAGAPTAAEGARSIAQIQKQAQDARDRLSKGDEQAAARAEAYANALKDVSLQTGVYADQTAQLADGVLPRDIDKTKEIQAEGEKLRDRLHKLADETGDTYEQADKLADAWITAKINMEKARQASEDLTRAQKEQQHALEQSDKFMADLERTFQETKAPLDDHQKQLADITKKYQALRDAAFGVGAAEGKVVEGARAHAKELIDASEANEKLRVTNEDLEKSLSNTFGKLEQPIEQFFTSLIDGSAKASDAFKTLEKSVASVLLQLVGDFAKSELKNLFTGATSSPSSSGGGFLSGLFNLFKGGGTPAPSPEFVGPLQPGPTPNFVGPLQPGSTEAAFSEATRAVTSGSDQAASGLSSLAGELTAFASIAIALGIGIKGAVSDAAQLKQATLGTGQAPSNVLKGAGVATTVAGVAGGAAIGATIGAPFFGVGALVGAAVGAAVGGAIAQAINQSLSQSVTGAVKDGVQKGLSQSDLEKQVKNRVAGNLLLNILAPGVNILLANLLGGLVTPDINRIFGKMLRQALGGEGGGFSTAGITVGTTATFGLGANLPEANMVGRLIAEAFGAGGQAFPGKREAQFSSIILGAARQRIKQTGEDASTVIAEELATAFGGNFLDALRSAFKLPLAQRDKYVQFTAGEFAKGTQQFGFNFQQQAQFIQQEGIVPGTKAIKESQKAFGDAFTAALQTGAESNAFQKSMEGSVSNAFISGVSKALASGPLGTAFAGLFSISNRPGQRYRRQFRRAKRRGDTGAEVDILSKEFNQDVQQFASIVSDPAFAAAIKTFNDDLLKLQVNMALASGDIKSAADAITARLQPSIDLLKNIIEETASLRDRAAAAIAGTGIAGQEATYNAALRRRQDAQRDFETSFGATLQDFKDIATGTNINPATFGTAGQRAADAALRSSDPQQLFDKFKTFADARVDELTSELDLLRAMRDAFDQAQKAFKGLHEQAQQALGTFDAGANAATLVADAQDKFQKLVAEGGGDLTAGFGAHPDDMLALADALSQAMTAVTQRLQFFQQALDATNQILDQIATARGGRTAQNDILQRTLADLATQLPIATGGGAGDEEATSKALTDLQTAVQLTTARFNYFTQAVDTFQALADQAQTSLLGLDEQSVLLARDQKKIAENLPTALGAGSGAEDAFDKLNKYLGEAIQITAQQVTFYKSATDAFQNIADQADFARRGRRGAREQLAGVQGQIEALLPNALAGSAQAMSDLQKFLPQAMQLAQQAFTGGRARAFDRYIQQIAEELAAQTQAQEQAAEASLAKLGGIASQLSSSAQAQATDADLQLQQLATNATALKNSADANTKQAKSQLEALDGIAQTAQLAAGAGLSITDIAIIATQQALQQFIDDVTPVLDYLQSKVSTTIHDDLASIATLLGDGPDAPIHKVLVQIAQGLPQGRASGGEVLAGHTYLVGERAEEFFTPAQTGMISTTPPSESGGGGTTLNVSIAITPPAAVGLAQADQYGRSIADPVQRAIVATVDRMRGLRKVA